MPTDTALYFEKAQESLAGAHSEFVNRRYNNCANRSYYVCFQAAIAALLTAGITQPSSGKWRHEFVKGQFAVELIRRRKRYPAEISESLERCYTLRQRADYEHRGVSHTEATHSLHRAGRVLTTITGGERS